MDASTALLYFGIPALGLVFGAILSISADRETRRFKEARKAKEQTETRLSPF